MMKNIYTNFILALSLGIIVLNPSQVLAATYQPQTTLEYISYLQGVVDTLRQQLNNNQTVSALVSTEAPLIESKTTLKSSYEIGSANYAYAWFEYGVGSLNKTTTKTKINKVRGQDTISHSVTISKLSNDTYSYRAVFETSRGTKYYGPVQSFSMGKVAIGTSGTIISSGSASISSSRGSLNLTKSTYKVGETIKINWTVPSAKKSYTNWIGLYEVEKNNDQYIRWQYLAEDTSGQTSFTLTKAGTYEFRLFYNNSYDDVLTSGQIKLIKE